MTELRPPSPVWLTALALSSSLASAGSNGTEGFTAPATSPLSPEASGANAEPGAVQGDGVPAMISFGDIDGDGLDDAVSVSALGQIALLVNGGNGQFRDITEASGLGSVDFATCALFTDFDGDGVVDLFLGSSSERLWRNVGGGLFASFQSNLDHDLVDLAAWSIDTDQDGLIDLHLRTEAGDLVYRNLGEGIFEHLPLTGSSLPSALAGVDVTTLDPDGTRDAAVVDAAIAARRRLTRWLQANRGTTPFPPTSSASSGFTATSVGVSNPAGAASTICAGSIEDQATGLCIQASSVGMLGMLYPLSSDLFVDAATGWVGMGTVNPSSRLSVAGNVTSDRFISTVGTGTAPLGVSSRTLVPLLNADFLDGLHAIDFRLAATQITSGDILDDSLTFRDLAPDSVTDSELAANSVGSAEIRNDAVTGAKVLNDSLSSADIGPDAITASELAPNSVGSENIIDGSVTGDDIDQAFAFPGQVLKWTGVTWAPRDDLNGTSQWTSNGNDIGYTPGRVGIGTPSPQKNLHITAASEPGILITGRDPNMTFQDTDAGGRGYQFLNRDGIFQLRDLAGGVRLSVEASGTVSVKQSLEIRGGADIVERFHASELSVPGTVVVIDPENPGQLMPSSAAYDTKVAGIVSGAGGVNPGICLSQEGELEGDTLVAMNGRVYVKATAANGAIQPGDRLTTSNLAGHAMKATDRDLWDGAVIGKAMTALESGEGLVLVLVNLQ
ncbi:hypothetical protein Poly30_50460 [Planctomycetes bacterium Poly30]|uniref:FG-GAP repeat protein n=1 Tax=Saltatorellus ferox TaxID=2528018 RepID=A0A518EZI4_9BACT|nr:hypothetical protein Poly30_50460 [Planctomycetes bacterium Poly30]